ncbi:MAG TPA: helix-turn-helix transcriptional regulator [Pirellulales bacterium]|jgi:DNA-binding XRE family transcriptional regulator
MKTEIIERKGKQFAVVPLKEFERLVHDADMLEDIAGYDEAKARKDEMFPSEVADRLVDGESPIRVFREYRKLTQEQLAKAAGIARAYLTELEGGKKQGSVTVLKKIADALKLELDDIIA